MKKNYLITAPPPTPNGDLHVGHISGPYFAADVFARYQTIRGYDVVYASGSDQNQTYVVTTAERLNANPKELGIKYHYKIRESLDKCSININGFLLPDDQHADLVQQFIFKLYKLGVVKEKEKEYWYSEELGRYLFEAYVNGFCNNCYAETKGGICESCGHPNDSFNLHLASATGSKSTITSKKVKGLYFEIENYREALKSYLEPIYQTMRPHLQKLLKDLLSKPLADFPISYPSSYGVPVNIPGYEDQVINVWAEMVPGLMGASIIDKDRNPGDIDKLWKNKSTTKLVQFLGFDNSYFFTVLHPALLMACNEDYILPSNFITNEFYLLDNFKFSTSQNHVIWARDIVETITNDELRFFVSYTNPELFQSNFNASDLKVVVKNHLTSHVENLIVIYNKIYKEYDITQAFPDFPEAFKQKLEWFYEEFEQAYHEDSFSVKKGVNTLTLYLQWLVDYARVKEDTQEVGFANEFIYGLLALVSFSHPLLPDFSYRLKSGLNVQSPIVWKMPGDAKIGDLNHITSLF